MQKNIVLAVFGILLLVLNTGCVYSIARYDGPYEGKIVDADTGNPIEGVVVLGVWYKETPTVAGAVSSYYEARETVTNKNGDFNIPGMGLKILSNVAVMDFLIFKAGYEYKGLWSWEALKKDSGLKVKWEDKKAIIPLRKLTLEERKSPPYPPTEAVKGNRARLLENEINKDRRERGLEVRE